jgi:hypothetical protein
MLKDVCMPIDGHGKRNPDWNAAIVCGAASRERALVRVHRVPSSNEKTASGEVTRQSITSMCAR